MVCRIVVSDRAETDLEDAFIYLAERSPVAAARWYRHVRIAIESLSEMPARCPLAPETAKLGFNLRHLVIGQHPSRYRIVFRIIEENQEVHVLTVRHGARRPLADEDIMPYLELP